MKRWALGLVLAFGLASMVQACGDDSKSRQAQEGDAGEAGRGGSNDAGGPGSDEGGGSEGGDGGNAGVPAGGSGGVPAMSAAGNQGNGGDGSGAACDSFDDYLAAGELCSNVRSCYPDLQDVETECVAPGNGGTVESYTFFDISRKPNPAAIRACLCGLADQQSARGFADCLLVALQAGADCYSACPELGDVCANPYSDASIACNDQYPDGFVDVATCTNAQ